MASWVRERAKHLTSDSIESIALVLTNEIPTDSTQALNAIEDWLDEDPGFYVRRKRLFLQEAIHQTALLRSRFKKKLNTLNREQARFEKELRRLG